MKRIENVDAEKCEQLAANIITECSRAASAGKLYDVDARLRPEGRNAPLAVARKQYLEYLQQRASLWERQSLTRARVISGDKDFSAEIMEIDTRVNLSIPFAERLDGRNSFDAPEDGVEKPNIVVGIPRH